jgi:hypothetical protein
MCVYLFTRVLFCVSVIFFKARSIVAMYARVSLCSHVQQEARTLCILCICGALFIIASLSDDGLKYAGAAAVGKSKSRRLQKLKYLHPLLPRNCAGQLER